MRTPLGNNNIFAKIIYFKNTNKENFKKYSQNQFIARFVLFTK